MPATNMFEKTSVTLKMLIESGIIKPGAEIVAILYPNVDGIINSDGSVTVYSNGNKKSFQSLSGAARYISKTSVNGWVFWYAFVDGEKHCLSEFRDKYIQLQSQGL